jgi:hypothetical protein
VIGISLARKPKESDGGASCEEMKDNQSSLESESDSESISSMSSSSDVISPGSLKDPQETVEIRRLISSVFGSIRSLYKLSTLLKRPSIPTKYLRSSTSGMSHSHRLSGYEYWDQKHVEEKMKQWAFDTNQSYEGPIDSNYFLTARLAAANTGRRRQLKYWQKNPDYQPEENRTSEPLRRQDESKVDLTSVQQSLRKPLPAKSQSEAITTPSGPTIQSFSTVPLTLLNDNETFSGRPRTIYAPSAAGGKRSRVPDAPRLPVGAHATQCPYCFTPLDATSVRKRDLWK